MFPYQSSSLGAQFEHRQTGGVIHIQWSSDEIVHLLVQTFPLIGLQLSVENLAALDFTAVGYQSVDQLHIAHFQREEGHGHLVVGGDILGHGKGERGLSHGGASSDDDQVARLPSTGDIVKFVVSCWHTGQTVLVGRSLLDDLNGVFDDRVNLGVILLHVPLRQFEERAFSLLHQVIHIDGVIKGFGLDA